MWPGESETEELLDRARLGEDAAVERLLQRHRDALRRIVELRLDPALRRRLDASDIVQDVLIEANRRLPDYLEKPAMPFRLWLRQMAKDRMIDAHRRHRVAARRSLDREQPAVAPAARDQSTLDLLGQLADRELTPAAEATWQELKRRFEAAVAELDDQDREIVMMRHFEQLSNSEVALALDLTPPAASMRYLRAMRRLRSLLDGDESSADTGG
jgi:RNA polymerase sigma-70 factor (ECF subfamily)